MIATQASHYYQSLNWLVGKNTLRRYISISFFAHIIIFVIFVFDIFNLIENKPLPLPTDVAVISEADFQKLQSRIKAQKLANQEAAKPEPAPEIKPAPKSDFADVLSAVSNLDTTPKKLAAPTNKKQQKTDSQKILKELDNLILTGRENNISPNDDTDDALRDLEEKASLAVADNFSPSSDVEEISEDSATSYAADETIEYALSVEEITILKEQIASCWSPPIGAKNLKNLVVRLRILLDENGILQDVKLISSPQKNNLFYRTAVESALRAIHHPDCTPLKLPSDKYDTWQKTIITFDPSQLLS